MKQFLLLLLLSLPSVGQVTINGGYTINGVGATGSIVSTTCTTINQSGALASATQGSAYGPITITASGGTLPYTWTTVGGTLPSGISVVQTGNNYVISGTPTGTGLSTFTFQAKDASTCSAVQSTFTINVVASNTLTLQAQTLPSITTGNAYPTTLLVATGGSGTLTACSITAGSLPTGMTSPPPVVNGSPMGCRLTGTVTASAGVSTFTVQVTDNASHTATQSYSITVSCASCGPPQTYSARTDLCELPGDPACTGGTAVPMKFDGSAAGMAFLPVLWETNVTAACPSPPCHRIGLNKTAIDPDFGALMVRVSDKFSPCNNGQFGIAGPSGGDVPWVGLTDTTLLVPTAFFLTQSSGQKFCLNSYALSTHTARYSQITGGGGPNGSTTQFANGASVAMSGTKPKHMFEFVSSTTKDIINDLTIDNDPSHTSTFDTILSRTLYRDLINGTNCLPSSYASLTKPPWTGTFNISYDDSVITIGISAAGLQGSGFEAVSVDVNHPGGCRYFVFAGVNTGVSGAYGCHYTIGGGMGTCTPDVPGTTYHFVTDNVDICNALVVVGVNTSSAIPCSIDDQFTLHGVNQSPDPAWFNTGVNNSTCVNGRTCSCAHNSSGNIGGCQEYFFNVLTNLVEPCSICAGHSANGIGYAYKQPGGGITPLRRVSRSLPSINSAPPSVPGSPNPGTIMSPSLPSDYHGSYNNTVPGDLTPMLLAMADTLSTNTQSKGWTNRPPYPSATYGEIIACSTVTIGTCYRLNHSFNSTLEQAFAPVENNTVMSPEGTFGVMMSDWSGNFGSITDGNLCNMVGGDAYRKSNTYVLGDEVTTAPPVAHGANQHDVNFKVTTAGISGTTLPAALNGIDWNKGAVVSVGAWLIPHSPNNTSNSLFQATAITTGAMGATQPNWDTSCTTSCVDGGVTWTNRASTVTDTGSPSSPQLVFTYENLNDCSGDAVIVEYH